MRTAADTCVELTVRDTGVGIPEQELPRLFERFHRVEGQRSRSFEGSGIGLALVQELVQPAWRDIDAESALGKGTTFIDPCLSEDASARGKCRQSEQMLHRIRCAPKLTSRRRCAGCLTWPGCQLGFRSITRKEMRRARGARDARILIVDDSADMRDYLEKLLAKRWQVETANDGRIALERLQRKSPILSLPM